MMPLSIYRLDCKAARHTARATTNIMQQRTKATQHDGMRAQPGSFTTVWSSANQPASHYHIAARSPKPAAPWLRPGLTSTSSMPGPVFLSAGGVREYGQTGCAGLLSLLAAAQLPALLSTVARQFDLQAAMAESVQKPAAVAARQVVLFV
jgi:hypothetical protein